MLETTLIFPSRGWLDDSRISIMLFVFNLLRIGPEWMAAGFIHPATRLSLSGALLWIIQIRILPIGKLKFILNIIKEMSFKNTWFLIHTTFTCIKIWRKKWKLFQHSVFSLKNLVIWAIELKLGTKMHLINRMFFFPAY